MMDEETRRDVVEAKEALERAEERWVKSPGSAHGHMAHALLVLKRVLYKQIERES